MANNRQTKHDDPALPVLPIPRDLKGYPAGQSPEADDDSGFNGMTPPGEWIQDQPYAPDTKRIANLKAHKPAAILASGTKKLD